MNTPNIHTCATQPLVLNNHSFGAKLGAGHTGRGQATATTANDEVVGLFADGRHGCS